MLKLQSMLLQRKLGNYCNIPSMLSSTQSSFSPCISSTCNSFAILIDMICSCKTVNKIQTIVQIFLQQLSYLRCFSHVSFPILALFPIQNYGLITYATYIFLPY